MTHPFTGKLEKIDAYRWRIPQTYMEGMRVPGIVISSEEMLRTITKDNSLQQVANAAHLPGIVRASMAMPDIHWGYGLPIGGVVATDIDEGGVISPGGVGYDINCLSGESKILLNTGAYIKIKDFEDVFRNKKLSCFDRGSNNLTETSIGRFLKIKPNNRVLEINTLNGNKITATEDHPFLTPNGMIPLKELGEGDAIAVYPFEGVPHEDPSDEIIIGEDAVKKFLVSIGKDLKGRGVEQIIGYLRKKEILPLKYNSPQLPYLLKVMGYALGDGSIYFTNRRGKGVAWFYGEEQDLEKIRSDIEKTGFSCSKTYSRVRDHEINTVYAENTFRAETFSCKVSSSAFAALLVCLGTPLGDKTCQDFRVPCWLKKAPLWQKRLFLAGFFGAEMSSPKTMTDHGYNFYCPIVSLNKQEEFVNSGKEFLSDLSGLLEEFDIFTNKVSSSRERTYKRKDGTNSFTLRLILSNKTDNLINLYSKVGFEYNQKRRILANAAAQYLKVKRHHVRRREFLASHARELVQAGRSVGSVYEELSSPLANRRFIERSAYCGRKGNPRVSEGTMTFDEFYDYAMRTMGGSEMLWDKIDSVKEIDFDDYVYDFTVNHNDHNFIADNFVVSNCGVRLVRTDLTHEEVRGHIKDLVDVLYKEVPAGVGSTGEIRVDLKEERNIMVRGASWAVERGFGWEEDLEHSEENGAIDGADPSKVSERAFQRGKKQPGTLGSGNHFVEVQVVDEVYRPDLAEVFGIKKGQVTVMIHTGSRGLGHQICGDYAEKMVQLLKKYNISMPDRQLACVPVKSEEGMAYLGAMRSAANYAWCNRQAITHLAREAFSEVFGESAKSLGMKLVYDVAHNIAKIEKYTIDGEEKTLCVHRKGATRAFPPHHEDIPLNYKEAGQPVIIPGDMGRYSYLLAGTAAAAETFYSTCHGAGRLLSRHAAKNKTRGRSISRELLEKGIFVRWTGRDTLQEEVSEAYKDVMDVVDIVEGAGISVKVARMKPLGVIKG